MAIDPHMGQFGLRMNGTTGIAKAIEVVTRSHTHHVVIGIGDGLVASAEPWRGVVIRPETDFPDLVWSKFPWTDKQAFNIAWSAELAEGRRYNYLAFVAMGAFGLFGYRPPLWFTKMLVRSKRVDCSELVVECLAPFVNMFPGPAWQVTPGDLERYARMRGWDMTPEPTKPLEESNA